jgi:demethylmenaquinone methyltransferase/2-methoxy-6-polyprenyl-1,4-benzoquinol methylase
MDTLEAQEAAEGGRGKRAYVRRIFSEIAPRYDLLNHVLSFNLDRRWRTAALRELHWEDRPEGRYIDLCAGTLDVGAQLAAHPGFRGSVMGADFAEPMLRAGDMKRSDVVAPLVADAVELPVADASSDGVIVAFGIRNLADLDAGLRETYRVLRPGCRLVILEFSRPRPAVVRSAYHAYFHWVLPVVGRLLSGHPTAYRYLPRSVAHFPEENELVARMTSAGFTDVRWRALTFGVAAVHVGVKSAGPGSFPR